jgi:hypothetical protein
MSADASYGTAFQQYWALARLGYRARPRLSLGLEGGVLGNEEYDAGRGGGFVRVTFRDFETTLSGGFTRQLSGRRPELLSPAWALPAILRLLVALAKVHCRPRSGSAWPRQMPPWQLNRDRFADAALPSWSCAFCVRGMSAGALTGGLSPRIRMT